MKKVLLFFPVLFIFLFSSSTCYSQSNNTYISYCEIIGSGNFSGNKIKISFDFGSQGFSYKANDDNFLVNDKGKEIEFTSMIDALNYMAKLGWKLDTAYSASIKGMGAQETYRYIIKKEVSSQEEVLNGIMLSGLFKKEKKKVVDDLYR